MSLNSNALITVPEYKSIVSLELDNTGVDDTQLEYLINSASQSVENYCCRKFITPDDQITETFEGFGDYDYYLKHCRIADDDVPVLYYWDGDSWETLSLTSYPYSYTRESGKIYFTGGDNFWKPTQEGFQNWKVTYKYGWAIASIPSDIKVVCADLVSRSRFRLEKTSLVSESFGDTSTTYDTTLLPDAIKRILDRYRGCSYG